MTDVAGLETALMKLLLVGPWQKAPHGPKLGLVKLVEALGKLGTPTETTMVIEPLLNTKGRGWIQTDPKIILKEEWATAEFQLWLTPLGKTEIGKRVGGGQS